MSLFDKIDEFLYKIVNKVIVIKVPVYIIPLLLSIILFLLLISCTSAPYVQKSDYIGQHNFSFGQHSVIIDKRFERYGPEVVTRNTIGIDKVKVTLWRWKWLNERVTVTLHEIENSTVYFKPVDWREYYKNVIYYEKEQFATNGDVYTYRMIRMENDIYVVSCFHFVGNQMWLITEYYFQKTMPYTSADSNSLISAADYMIHIRHNKIPKQIISIQKGIERFNAILFD